MNSKIIIAFVLVAFAAAAQSKLVIKKDAKPKQLNSADVEALLDPTVQSLANGQHKLVFKGASGQEQCVVCQPFQGCGCRDVVAIRCELKRLKQKLLRLKRIAHPHARSHHGRDEVEVKPAVIPAPKPAVQPAVQPVVKVTVEKKKPVGKKLVRPAPKVLIAPKPLVQPLEKPAVQPAPKPLVQPLVKVAVQPEVKPAEKPLVKLAVQPEVKPNPAILIKPYVKARPAVLVAEKKNEK